MTSLLLVATLACGGGGAGPSDGDPVFDVAVDPYSINPLAAVVNVRGIEAAEVESVRVVVQGLEGSPDLVRTYLPGSAEYPQRWDSSDLSFPAAGFHVPVVGLFADRRNRVEILLDTRDGSIALTAEIETHLTTPDDPMGTWVPTIEIAAAVPERMEPGWTVFDLDLGDWPRSRARPLAIDERGAVRWMLRLDLLENDALPLLRSYTGNFLTGRSGTILEITELGRVVRRMELSGFVAHHELQEIGEGPFRGDLLVVADAEGSETLADRIVQISRSSGSVVRVWDLRPVLDPHRTALADVPEDWLHANGLAYSASEDALVVSGRHQGVIKIGGDGRVRWILAPHRGWSASFQDVLLTAVDDAGSEYAADVQDGAQSAGAAEFDWPWGQHAPSLLAGGDLLLFDNGWNRRFDLASATYSRAVIFHVDERARTVRQVWQYGAERGPAFYSPVASSAAKLPATGNVLVQPALTGLLGPATAATATEIAPDGTLLFEVKLTYGIAAGGRLGVDYSYRAHRYEL